MSKPAVGSGAEHSNNVARGAAEANAVRDRWLTSLIKGEVSFALLANASYSEGPDRHLAKLTLYKILSKRPGWSITTALEALTRNGFERKTTISSIRRSPEKVEIFASILETSADRWKGRPEVPQGWPWNGKLNVLVANAGESLPTDIQSLFEEAEDDVQISIPSSTSVSSDDVSALFGDDD